MTDQLASILRRSLSLGLTLAAIVIACCPTGRADDRDGFGRFPRLFGRKDEPTEEKKTGALISTVNWWSVPKTARTAAKKLAANQDASVSRCVAVDQGDMVSFEIHASRRTGLFKRTDFVLTRVSEPKTTVERRKEEQTLKKRMARFRDFVLDRNQPDAPLNKPVYADPQ